MTDDLLEDMSPGRVPPHALSAEKGVFGCIFLSPVECMNACSAKIPSETVFYDLRHQELYKHLLDMHQRKQPIDLITLQSRGNLESFGGIAYLSELPDSTPSSANLEYYLDIVLEKHQARSLIELADGVLAKAYAGEDLPQLIDQMAVWTTKAAMGADSTERPVKEVLRNVIDQLERERRGVFDNVLPTQLRDFDRRNRGLVKQEMMIIAGRPSAGKTAFALQLVLNLAKEGIPVGVFSLEMTSESLLRRMAGAMSGQNISDIRGCSDHQMVKITAAMMRLTEMPLRIHDEAGMSIRKIQAVARDWVVRHKVQMIVVDYIQLATASTKRGKEHRQEEISEISAGLKNLAKELNIAMVVLAQLNRDVEKRGGKPRMSDLKESGALEQDGDHILFLWYNQKEDAGSAEQIKRQIDQPVEEKLMITMTTAKRRNGATGDIHMYFDKPTQRFLDIPYEFDESQKDHP